MFLSGLIILYPGKPYELSDDLESFLHVLVIQLLRFHKHDFSTTQKRESLYKLVFDKYITTTGAGGYRTGQPTKMFHMKYGVVSGITLRKKDYSPQFLDLLTSLVRLCQQHYELLDTDTMAGLIEPPFIKVSTEDMYHGKEQDSPLKNHDAMLAAFAVACRSPDSDWISDKIGDQFEGILLKGNFLQTPQNKRSSSEFEESATSQKRMKGPSVSSASVSLHPVSE